MDKSSSGKLPLPPNAENIQLRVIAKQWQILMNCLRCQHAVEGIFMPSGQVACAKRMFRRNGEQLKTRCSDPGDEIFGKGTCEIELAQTVFRRNFPCGSCGHEYFAITSLNHLSRM